MPNLSAAGFLRRWAGWLIAYVVLLGLADSKIATLVATSNASGSVRAIFQTKRAEQKSPRDISATSFVSSQSLRAVPLITAVPDFRSRSVPAYGLALFRTPLCTLSVRSFESTRGPPLMG